MFRSFLAASTKLQFAFKVRFYGESFSKIELIAGFVGATLQKERLANWNTEKEIIIITTYNSSSRLKQILIIFNSSAGKTRRASAGYESVEYHNTGLKCWCGLENRI